LYTTVEYLVAVSEVNDEICSIGTLRIGVPVYGGSGQGCEFYLYAGLG
jgi:hypothetical protein